MTGRAWAARGRTCSQVGDRRRRAPGVTERELGLPVVAGRRVYRIRWSPRGIIDGRRHQL